MCTLNLTFTGSKLTKVNQIVSGQETAFFVEVEKISIRKCDTEGNIISRKEGNVYLTTHSTHFIYGYMASDIW